MTIRPRKRFSSLGKKFLLLHFKFYFEVKHIFIIPNIPLGNQTSNKNRKQMQKKEKKTHKRNEKKVNAVADVLENFSLDMGGDDQDYSFEADFN